MSTFSGLIVFGLLNLIGGTVGTWFFSRECPPLMVYSFAAIITGIVLLGMAVLTF